MPGIIQINNTMNSENLKLITRSQIEAMDKIRRLNLVNSVTGYKSANLLGTRSAEGMSNLAIIGSVVHLSSSPPVLGFMQRPTTVPRHSYQNILETGTFTINHVHEEFVDRAHYTSAKFEKDESEFLSCSLGEQYLDGFPAPFVQESRLKLGIKYLESYEIKASNTLFVVGSIERVYLPEAILHEDGQLDLNMLGTVALSGLNNYHAIKQIASFPYARPGQFPINQLKREE
jgi:flavin reductase (DIM6/NTAB) family NADH-FMN oxidoreductase RutF